MTEHPSAPAAAPDSEKGADKPGSILKDWIIPIVVGLAIGAALVLLWQWKIGPMFTSPAASLVAQWDPQTEEEDGMDRLETEIRALGADAREDLLAAFRGIEFRNDYDAEEHKLWAARMLVREPFRDARSLVEILRDPSQPAWDRRIAAAALVDELGKDVDPLLVTDPLLDWLEDATLVRHIIPAIRLKALRTFGIFPKDREKRYRDALFKIAAGADVGRPLSEEEEARREYDRHVMIGAIQGFAPSDEEVRELLWRIGLDEAEDLLPRAAAFRGLSEERIFEKPAPQSSLPPFPGSTEKWRRAASAADETVRQTVAENLFRSPPDPAVDEMETAFHADPAPLVRSGSVDAQERRMSPTMLPVVHELLEDHSPEVRAATMMAVAAFRRHVDGLPARQAHVLRFLESSQEPMDVMHAIMSLTLMTGKHHGFAEGDVDLRGREVEEGKLGAFMADAAGRAAAVAKWRVELGEHAVWTDAQQRETLTKLLKHSDPDNVARAKAELEK